MSWGYKRIEGALSNVGYSICCSTVANILKHHGVEPAPRRQRQLSWNRLNSLRDHRLTVIAASPLADVPSEWVERAIDNCLLEVAVALDRFVGYESMAVVFFRYLNRMNWMGAALLGTACAGWFAVQGAPWLGLFFGLMLAVPVFLAIRLLRPLLLPASFWREEPLGRKVLRSYGVSTVWGMRFVSLLLLTLLAAAVYLTCILAK